MSREDRRRVDYARSFDDPSILSAEVLGAALLHLPSAIAQLVTLPLKPWQKRKMEQLRRITNWDEVDDKTKAQYIELVRTIEQEVIDKNPQLSASKTEVLGIRTGDGAIMLEDIFSRSDPETYHPYPFDLSALERKKG